MKLFFKFVLMNEQIITYWDWLLAPFYILIIYIIAVRIKKRNINKNQIYKYFIWGLFAKIVGAISVCLIYVYYYKVGGDTLAYHSSSVSFVNLLFYSFKDFLHVYLSPALEENFYLFNSETGFPTFYNQPYEVMVVKLLVPLELISFKSYIVTSIITGVISYSGVWKLYQMFCELSPKLYKEFSVVILFVPSVVFWGSGILKDSWTLGATGWLCYSFYKIFISKTNIISNSISIIISAFILLSIKPYIFIALFPGCLIWGTWNKMLSIKNNVLRFFFMPAIFCVGIVAGVFVWSFISSGLGQYSSIDRMLQKTVDSSFDLKQDYYHGNSFDIGSFEPTFSGISSKFPIATFTGLFRPFLWESKNIVMILSGLENLITLFFVVFVFFNKPIENLKRLFSKPIVLFSLIFAIFFSFSVALSTSNFGALVRLRIPQIPFLLSGLVILGFEEKKKMNNIIHAVFPKQSL